MTLAELKQKADTKLIDLWDKILSQELAYFAKHKTYFGLNWTPALEVLDGGDTIITTLSKPSRNFIGADVYLINEILPFQIQIIKHEGKDGQGFTAYARVTLINGTSYIRTKGYGMYSTTSPWTKELTIFDR